MNESNSTYISFDATRSHITLIGTHCFMSNAGTLMSPLDVTFASLPSSLRLRNAAKLFLICAQTAILVFLFLFHF